ncbi:hypothetical protein DFJ58DRAFT_736512 [Suillus subalutaceus]|uniref:uncharacterized protein n=1 Tax=Suillus subalutaceus TaxID=48586 RepID=UPI001B85C495|nr:uncharacterized protein DFJ58DRAFT_736512 [Suillus subalutaceus]KAG1831932.1 hypothetical protein DFJ58DRAFT_736512 [Suillus subalutaceus]
MALRKATSKRTKSGAPVSPLEMEPLARTMSGRQRRPTEKASYQGLELQQVLKMAYQNDPDHFEKEPSVLLSDIDKEEDTMFSDHSVQTKLSKPKLLTFSTGEDSQSVTHHHSHNQCAQVDKGSERVVPPSDRDLDGTSDGTSTTSDDTSDESGNDSEPEADQIDNCAEDGDTAMESSMAAQGIKRCLDTRQKS